MNIYLRLYHFVRVCIPVMVFALAGCTDDELPTPVPSPEQGWLDSEYFRIIPTQPETQSRATAEDEIVTTFDEGDHVGAFALDGAGNVLDSNVKMTVSNRIVVPTEGEQYTYQTLTPADAGATITKGADRYLFYYPYDATMTIDKARKYRHSVLEDQRPTDGDFTAFEKSDLLWSYVSPESKHVDIDFDHAMATIVVYAQVKDYYKYETVEVLGQPMSAQEINLGVKGCDNLKYKVNESPASDIFMTNAAQRHEPDPDGGVLKPMFFRAAVPANRIIEANGKPLIRVTYNDKTVRTFKIKSPLELKPGKNYIFSIANPPLDPPTPNMDEEDSWVLDVIDPKTGKQVGLLCREYLYWAPQDEGYNTAPRKTKEQYTGEDKVVPDDPDLTTGPCINRSWYSADKNQPLSDEDYVINSQAWVFYPMTKSAPFVPDLRKGTVMRFIYDIMGGGGNHGYKYRGKCANSQSTLYNPMLPAPHKSPNGQWGLYSVKHGHEWVGSNITNGTISEGGVEYPDILGGDHMMDSPYEFQYHMHGLDITWDLEKNRISGCTPYTEQEARNTVGGLYGMEVTNAIAIEYGHIAIDGDDAYVSYHEYDKGAVEDSKGKSVGQLIPHYLVDVRPGETIRYPVVKIGANSFWMAADLRCTVMNDGRPIKYIYSDNPDDKGCQFVIPKEDGVVKRDNNNQNDVWIWTKPSFTYAAGLLDTETMTGEATKRPLKYQFDPVNDPYIKERVKTSHVCPMFNFAALYDPGLQPLDINLNEYYSIITYDDWVDLMYYVGTSFAGKLLSDKVFIVDGDRHRDYTPGGTNEIIRDQLLDDYWCFHNWYLANISGLKFAAPGYYASINAGAMGRDMKSYDFGSGITLFLKFKDGDSWGHNSYGEPYLAMFFCYPYSIFNNSPTHNYGAQGYGSKMKFNPGQDHAGYTWNQQYRSMAPVRAVFHFRHQKDNIYKAGQGINNLANTARSRAALPPQKVSRNVYVELTE